MHAPLYQHSQVLHPFTNIAMNDHVFPVFHYVGIPLDSSYRSTDPSCSKFEPCYPHYSHYQYRPYLPNHYPAHETTNPKVTIVPQPPQTYDIDIDTPSSASSSSVLTPLSPALDEFMNFRPEDADLEMEEFDYDEDEDEDEDEGFDSEFLDDMDDDGEQAGKDIHPQLAGADSALAGALGLPQRPSSFARDRWPPTTCDQSDRRISSAPGRTTSQGVHCAYLQHSAQRYEPLHPTRLSSGPAQYPHNDTSSTQPCSNSSAALLAPSSQHSMHPVPIASSSSSLAGAISASLVRHSQRHHRQLPILQPQPVRPIPPIPLSDLEVCATEEKYGTPPQPKQGLSPLSLLCQPVSDVVRYQLKASPRNSIAQEARDGVEGQSSPGRNFSGDVSTYAHPSERVAEMDSCVCSCGCRGVGLGWH